MERYRYPSPDEWKSITERPHIDTVALHSTVRNILEDVKAKGDKAIIQYEEKFDHAILDTLSVSAEEMENAVNSVPTELLEALTLAHKNISTFHASQRIITHKVETAPGVECWQKSVPITTVGLYVPGGTAPLFSTVLMLATPAKIAGCPNIIMCTPPRRDGSVNPAILAAARIAGVDKIYKAGGVQAIAGMAYGTESIPKVFKIFGPGNSYVMAAKQIVSLHDVAIDMPAGPSEVCVIADETSNAAYVAADLLSQAEHGTDSQVLLITTSEDMADKVELEIERQLKALPRMEIAAQTLCNSKIVIVKDKEEALSLSNMYAPEHLIIATDDNAILAEKVVNAGSVFLGKYACESAGDYASGTNHTLPTHGYATAYNGVNLDSFVKKITFQHITAEGIRQIGHAVEAMAENEKLYAHKNAMTLRIRDTKDE
jgi:histidinol dehydrogenase